MNIEFMADHNTLEEDFGFLGGGVSFVAKFQMIIN